MPSVACPSSVQIRRARNLVAVAALTVAAIVAPTPASAGPLGVASDFNVLVFGDFHGERSDVEGRLAVGGNLYIEDFDIGLRIPGVTGAPSLVTGGDIDFTRGQIHEGGVIAGGDAAFRNFELTDPGDVDAHGSFALTDGSIRFGGVRAGGDVTLDRADVAGDVHAGRDAVITTEADVTAGSLTAGGTVTADPGDVFGTITAIGVPTAPAAVPLDFDVARQELFSLSDRLNGLETTGTVTRTDGLLMLTGGGSEVEVFSIMASALEMVTELRIDVDDAADVLVNVTGDSLMLSAFGFSDGEGSFTANDLFGRLLFNLPDADVLSLDAIGVPGSVLAPSADVTFFNGQLNGTLVANSITSVVPDGFNTGQFNTVPLAFDGGTPEIPTPGTLMLVAGALAMWGVARRRRPAGAL